MDWRWRSWNANPRSSKSSNSIYHQIFNRGRHNNTANNNRSASHKKVLIQTADYNHHEYAIELLPWKYDWPARIKSFSKTQCCFPLVLCMFCLFHVFILLKCWHLAENMLLFPKVPLILWIGYKPSTRCGRVHFEHSHRKWLVITVRPTTSVRESPRKNLPPRNTPDSFCRCFTRQNPSLRCVGGIFLQIEPYVVVQISEFYLQLLTAQLQSVILALERSRTQCPHCVRLSSYWTLNLA